MKKENFFVKNKFKVLLSFIALIAILFLSGLMKKIDIFINGNISSIYSPAMDKIIMFVIGVTNIIPSIFFATAILFFLLAFKHRKIAFIFYIGAGISFLINSAIKLAVQRVRPENALINLKDYSFPSGHSTISIFIFMFLIYAFRKDIKNTIIRKIFVTICILSFLSIGFSRIYTNVHWFSDVISGFVLGSLIFALSTEFIKHHKPFNYKK